MRPCSASWPFAAALGALLCVPAAAFGAATFSHRLEVVIDPGAGTLDVTDTVDLPAEFDGGVFYLNEGLRIEPSDGAAPQPLPPLHGDPPWLRPYRIGRPANGQLRLRYRGRLGDLGAGPGTNTIRRDGVFLDGASGWYLRFGSELVSFSMRVKLPQGWSTVSQGERVEDGDGSTRWSERAPQDDIVLVAGHWHRYEGFAPAAGAGSSTVPIAVDLREPDPALAARYLDATAEYLALYGRLIGPYPYAKFAVVENFRETGFGFPSFTLLGPRVIRLPFLLKTSLPHEVLHDWWGNGVFVDARGGNWSEGLTAYLADHLMKEREGRGAEYRRAALQKYRNYVDRDRDFALADFRSAHGGSGQAVGYNKALMAFHMLRRRLGDRVFVDGLRRFYRARRFTRASYADLRSAFEEASGESLGAFFTEWVDRVGAPALALDGVEVAGGAGGGYRLHATLRQTQSEPPYRLQVPVAVAIEGESAARETFVAMDGREAKIDLRFDARPLRIAVDPEFDVFRRVDRAEIPPALGELLGAPATVAILPRGAPAAVRETYRHAARGIGVSAFVERGDPRANATPRWVLGWENGAVAELAAGLARQDASLAADGAVIDADHRVTRTECVVLATRDANGRAIGFIGCDDPRGLAAITRKLSHYGPFGYAVFEAATGRSLLRGQWAHTASPLDRDLVAGTHAPLRLAPRTPLTAVR